MANIWDVAKEAGVSKTTVSRVLNNPESVKDETRQRVENAMESLNYTPSFFGRGIRTGKTRTIALLIPDYSNVFYNQQFIGVEEVALQNDYMVMICNTHKNIVNEIEYAQDLVKRNIDGIIYNTYIKSEKTADFFTELSKTTPVVFMDKNFKEDENVSYVLTEGYEASKKAVQYLHQKGCKRVGYIRVPAEISVVHHRYEGYKQGVMESQYEFDRDLVFQLDKADVKISHLEAGMRGAEYLMGLDNPPDAIMASIDIIAIGAIRYLNANGYKIPEQVKVIGYDNIDLCEYVQPTLTTIAQPIKEIGQKAAEILIAQINEQETENRIIFEPEFIIRESS